MRSWKTTLIGFGLAVVNLVEHGFTWKAALVSAGLAALGAASKDSDKSHAPSPLPKAAPVHK